MKILFRDCKTESRSWRVVTDKFGHGRFRDMSGKFILLAVDGRLHSMYPISMSNMFSQVELGKGESYSSCFQERLCLGSCDFKLSSEDYKGYTS